MKNISIIMPTYNSEKFVVESINSIINQTYEQWELIVVDDKSTDNTVKVIKEKFGEYKNIKIVENKINSGAGVTRNVGLEHAKGSMIAFLDSDDVWHYKKLESQMKKMQESDCAIIHTSYAFISETGDKINGKVNVSNIVDLNSYMKNTEIGMSTALINKDKVGSFKFDSMRTRQDTNLWLTLLSKGFTSQGINDELVQYRVRKGQISKNKAVVGYRTLKLYLSVKSISLPKRLLNFFYYTFNGFKKRM